jgi:SMC interacting uncharacterized protein involved in chromosome segregation
MSLKDTVNHAVNDVKDAASEAQHRSSAEAEKTRREVDGDNMTAGEKLGSVANEATNRTQAELDKTKRDVRDNT